MDTPPDSPVKGFTITVAVVENEPDRTMVFGLELPAAAMLKVFHGLCAGGTVRTVSLETAWASGDVAVARWNHIPTDGEVVDVILDAHHGPPGWEHRIGPVRFAKTVAVSNWPIPLPVVQIVDLRTLRFGWRWRHTMLSTELPLRPSSSK